MCEVTLDNFLSFAFKFIKDTDKERYFKFGEILHELNSMLERLILS